MTTQTTQELDELVAEKLGWQQWVTNNMPFTDGLGAWHHAPSDPRELFDLMVRYDVWPLSGLDHIIWMAHNGDFVEETFNHRDHASKLEAATRVILHAVLARIEGEKK